MELSLTDIASLLDGELSGGSPDIRVTDIAEIQVAGDMEIAFVGNSKYYKFLESTRAAAVIVPDDYDGTFIPRIAVKNPQMAVKILVDKFRPPLAPAFNGIHETAIIDPTAKLGTNVSVGPYAVIDREAEIGDDVIIGPHSNVGQGSVVGKDTRLYPNVTIYERCIIGESCIIHSGTVIGSDGYGFTFDSGEHKKIRQVGIVRIGDRVEIGANSTIDRAALGETVVGDGSKLDNMVHLGHNVKIGKGCLLVAQVAISGSTELGNYVTVGGQVGFAGHLKIGDGVQIAAKAGVTKDIPAGSVIWFSGNRSHAGKKTDHFYSKTPRILYPIEEFGKENR